MAVHDIGDLAPDPGCPELVVMPWSALPSLLDGWSHYQLNIVDLPGMITDNQAIELARTSFDVAAGWSTD